MQNYEFYNVSTKGTIFVFKVESNDEFFIPTLLSYSIGVNKFLNFDDNQEILTVTPTINNRVLSVPRNIVIKGTLTLNPNSLSLSQIRSILNYQLKNNVTVYGTALFVNLSTQTVRKYTNFSFISNTSKTDINKKQEDVPIRFCCNSKVEEVELGGLFSPILNIVSNI